MSITNPNAIVTEEGLSAFYQAISPYLHGPDNSKVYGFRIDNNESVPSAKVTYLKDAIGMTPAHMDYENDVFDYGSWENAFFMPKPCMLKYDGTVDYYLDPNDYSKKLDGSASDVANTAYSGNAMMEWPKIWLKIVPDGTQSNKSADIYVSNYQADPSFTDWNYHNSLGQSMDHFYTGIYHGFIVDNVLRSLSDKIPSAGGITTAKVKEFAEANNKTNAYLWTMDLISDIDLINILLVLIGKSTDTQTVFGKGLCSGGSPYTLKTGIHDDKGLFYGTNSPDSTVNTNAVKVFGMENWWGMLARRYLGEVVKSGIRYRKLTYGTEDGSSTNGYAVDGTGFIKIDIAKPSGGSDTPLKEIIFNEYGLFPTVGGGSSSTYYCDQIWASNSGTRICIRGAHYNNGEYKAGAFSCAYNAETSYTAAGYYGSSLSCKPIVS